MLKPVDGAARATRLADMGVVRAQGADAVKFLQGQVSNDVTRLSADRSVLAGLHNPQGRAIAVLRLVWVGPEEILALVPRELAAGVAARLSKFVLRAKVKIADVSLEWVVDGWTASGHADAGQAVAGIDVGDVAEALPAASIGAARRDGQGRLWVRVATSRWLVVASKATSKAVPADEKEGTELHVGSLTPSVSPTVTMPLDEWHAADIAAGIPQVFAATTEAFVAQMLNLDLLDGIAFDKGCYTGQEVIARAHYRGKVKRRMQRFRTRVPATLSAGDSGTLTDGRGYKVVDAVTLSDGRSEFLAVAPMTGSAADEEAPPASAASTPNAAPVPVAPLDAEQLPLPYALPA